MKYFLDSAKINEIREAYDTFGIDGVTTNPNHIMLSGKPFKEVLKEMIEFVQEKDIVGYEKFPISVEINPHLDDKDEMVKMGKEISDMCPNFVIKIPCTEAGIAAARELEKMGVRTNVTLVFSPSQAILPAKNGSLFVSPFIGWKENSGEDCVQYIQDIVDIYSNYGYETEIICAAVRNGKQFVDCAVAGADIVTAGLQVYKDSMYHPFTDYGMKKFQNAWDNTVTD
ncbi:MAG: transaldolase [Lachnospiraceae bacterium]|jgi:transaldolase|nr:transaldolase [Lachnospiraceae bacterium]MBQ2089509.1 transaldolase [Lachnospiraceae bacterium]MBR1571394.1 transaldolase [Lachnospiraceae bacterium]